MGMILIIQAEGLYIGDAEHKFLFVISLAWEKTFFFIS